MRLLDYEEHAVGGGADAAAISFVEIRAGASDSVIGVGMHRNILTASLTAITNALNRGIRDTTILPPKTGAVSA
jgi:2-isopropylmalate synthase